MANGDDNVTGAIPPELAQQLDPAALQQIVSSMSSGGAPQQAQPQDAGSQQPNPMVPQAQGQPQGGSSSLPPAIQQAISAMSTNSDNASTRPKALSETQGGLSYDQAKQQANSGVIKPKIGGLPGLILDWLHPNRGVAPGQQTPSKLDHFNDFLTNFMTSLSAGFANEGHGPGAAMRGAGAAMQAPYQQAVQQHAMQQASQKNQAEIQAQQAEAEQKKTQTERMKSSTTVTMPSGAQMQVPNDQLSGVLKSLAPAQARMDAANTAAEAKTSTQNQVNKVLGEAAEALKNGDIKGYQAKLAEAGQMAQAQKPATVKNNESEWIARVISNPNDKDAAGNLKMLQDRRKELMDVRGESMGKGRLYQIQPVYHPDTGKTDYMTGFQILDGQKNGDSLIPTGRLPQDKVIAVQQLQSEAGPALKQVRSSLGAFDNATDRAIFAKVMKGAGAPAPGQEGQWVNNIIKQAGVAGLSDKGKDLLVAEGRMAETLGRMRGVLGLQATDSAMALTLGLMAGVDTPNSKFAKDKIDTIDDMINKAVDIPALGGKGGMPNRMTGGAPKKGGVTADQLLKKYPPQPTQ